MKVFAQLRWAAFQLLFSLSSFEMAFVCCPQRRKKLFYFIYLKEKKSNMAGPPLKRKKSVMGLVTDLHFWAFFTRNILDPRTPDWKALWGYFVIDREIILDRLLTYSMCVHGPFLFYFANQLLDLDFCFYFSLQQHGA
jgi:hypothetical protein